MRLFATVVSTLALVVGLFAFGSVAAVAAAPAPVSAPEITGKAVFKKVLTVDEGLWTEEPETVTFQWLRDGVPIEGATTARWKTVRKDVGARLSVTVTASNADGATEVTTAAVKVKKARFKVKRRAQVTGTGKFNTVLKAKKPKLKPRPKKLKAQWLRDGKPIKKAKGKRHKVRAQDVGHRIRVRWVAKRPGYAKKKTGSKATRGKHRVGVRRTVTYSVQTRGRITTSLKKFKKLAQATFDDPRGWRAGGIKFRRVAKGGSFTLVLAEASKVPGFHPICSAQWSCRVGRYVVINQTRWKHASPAWNANGGSLRGYRHMVVNHETGHWLGLGHRHCPRAGAPAPVMQQQSKGLQGCKFNAFPTGAERASAR